MTASWVDTATRLTPQIAACFAANGIVGVLRYYDDSDGRNPKALTPEEAQLIAAAGLRLGAVYETTGGASGFDPVPAGFAYFTRAQGEIDAAVALVRARACGQPEHTPIYFAVDTADVDAGIVEYFNGVDDVLTAADYIAGVYGDYDVIVRSHSWPGVPAHWETYAWSAGRVATGNNYYQRLNGQRICGVSVDIDDAGDLEGWIPKGAQTMMDPDELNRAIDARIAENPDIQNTFAAIKDVLKEQHAAIEKLANGTPVDAAAIAELKARLDRLHDI